MCPSSGPLETFIGLRSRGRDWLISLERPASVIRNRLKFLRDPLKIIRQSQLLVTKSVTTGLIINLSVSGNRGD